MPRTKKSVLRLDKKIQNCEWIRKFKIVNGLELGLELGLVRVLR